MKETPAARAQARMSSWLLFALLVILSFVALNGIGGVFPGGRAGAYLGRGGAPCAGQYPAAAAWLEGAAGTPLMAPQRPAS